MARLKKKKSKKQKKLPAWNKSSRLQDYTYKQLLRLPDWQYRILLDKSIQENRRRVTISVDETEPQTSVLETQTYILNLCTLEIKSGIQ